MTSRVQTNRSTATGNRPPSTRPVGEFYVNFADLQVGVVDPTPAARDLLAIRFHSPTAAYIANDLVQQAGGIYQAKAAIPAHAFNAIEWNQFLTSAQGDTRWLPLTGGTLVGPLTLSGPPINALHAVTKSYVDGFLPLAGGTLTGPFSVNMNAFDLSAPNPGFVYALGAQVGGITGTLPIGQTYSPIAFRNKGTTDTVHSPYGGGVSLLGVSYSTGGPGATGNRTGMSVVASIDAQTGNKAAGYSNGFYGAAAWTMQMSANDGGVDFTDAGSYGNAYSINPVTTLYSGATFLHGTTVAEFDIDCRAGSSTRYKSAAVFVQLSTDVVQASAPDADGALVIVKPPAAVGWRDFGLSFATPYGQWPFNASASLIKAYQDQGGSTQSARWGLDMIHATFPATGNAYDGGFFRTKGAAMDGAGMLRLGTTYLTPGTTGLTIDAKGSVGVSATVAAGGANWVVGLFARDPYGGFWRVTSSGGPATAVSMVVAPTFPTRTPPANPVALTAYGTAAIDYSATGLAINIAWNTTATVLALQPSGGATTFGGPVTVPAGSTIAGYLPLAGGTVTGNIAANAFVVAATGGYLAGNASATVLVWDSGGWNLQYVRATGRLSYIQGGSGTELFAIDQGNVNASGSINANIDVGAQRNVVAVGTVQGAFVTSMGDMHAVGTISATLDLFGSRSIAAGSSLYAASNNIVLGPGGSGYIMQMTGGYYFDYNTATGEMHWTANNNPLWVMRANDALCFNNAYTVAGHGVYINLASSAAMKTDIMEAPHGLDEIIRLTPKTFRLKARPDRVNLGFIIEDVRPVIPEAVTEHEGVEPGTTMLGISDTPILAAVVNAIKTLNERVAALEAL